MNEAILTVIIGSVIGLIGSFVIGYNAYCRGYKRQATEFLRMAWAGIIGANVFYWGLVLMIGLAPMHR